MTKLNILDSRLETGAFFTLAGARLLTKF